MFENNIRRRSGRIGDTVKRQLFSSEDRKVRVLPDDQPTEDLFRQIKAEPMTGERKARLRATVLRLFSRPTFVAPRQLGSITIEASLVHNIMSTSERHRRYYQLLEELQNCEIIDMKKTNDESDAEEKVNCLS